jgi:putative DNA primase/helicase
VANEAFARVKIDQLLKDADWGRSGSGKVDAIQFLQDILSSGPVDVLEVECQARSAALLEDDRRLSKSKAFRDARSELGIKSTRTALAPGSRYALELPGVP